MGDIDIVFDSMPGPDGCTFIEAEDEDGHAIRAGAWIQREDGYAALRIPSHYDGARHALHRFAWWRDGVEYVGSTGYTLAKALADVDAAEAEGRSYSLGA